MAKPTIHQRIKPSEVSRVCLLSKSLTEARIKHSFILHLKEMEEINTVKRAWDSICEEKEKMTYCGVTIFKPKF